MIISFADRRWVMNSKDNLYTIIGFKKERILPPDFTYISMKNYSYKRIPKEQITRERLMMEGCKCLSAPLKEMAKEMGYYRIYDCGLIKYMYTRQLQNDDQ